MRRCPARRGLRRRAAARTRPPCGPAASTRAPARRPGAARSPGRVPAPRPGTGGRWRLRRPASVAAASSPALVCIPSAACSATCKRIPGQRGGRPGPLPRVVKPGGPVATQGIQHQVPGPAIRPGPRRGQQRAVHQAQHPRPGGGAGDCLGTLQGERRREHRNLAEDPLLLFAEQLVTPLNGRRQRPVPGCRQPVTGHEKPEPVVQAFQQLRHTERFHPSRGQLDRQRHPIQPLHQLGHHRTGLAAQREMRVNPAGPVSEQSHRLRPARLQSPGPGSASGGSRYRASPATPTGSRLVARIRTSSAAGSSAPHSSATAAITCSQLSSTSSICRRASTPASESATGTPGRCTFPTPRPPPTAPATRPRPLPAPPATPRRRTGQPHAGPPHWPAGSYPPRPARSPSPAGSHSAGQQPRRLRPPGRRNSSGQPKIHAPLLPCQPPPPPKPNLSPGDRARRAAPGFCCPAHRRAGAEHTHPAQGARL